MLAAAFVGVGPVGSLLGSLGATVDFGRTLVAALARLAYTGSPGAAHQGADTAGSPAALGAVA